MYCTFQVIKNQHLRHTPRVKPKKSKERNLIEQMVKYKLVALAFALYPEVPLINNQAESDVRQAKVKQKVAGCFRTNTGKNIYALPKLCLYAA